ncbi:MAG: AAA family ATPase [Candidatus Altiarchaeota archaeon]|nr:AAA family ATPase [Candidatus Altiarchaeota archaeon]
MIEEYLDPNYIPELLPHRENEVTAIFEMFRPLLENRRPSNAFIHGGPGIGKTAVAKLVLREIKEEGVIPIYINCWYHRTEAAVLAEILRQMSVPFPRKGRGVDELITEFMERVKGEKLLVVLDEIDLLENPDVLYELSRASPTIGALLISNDQYATKKFDSRVRSSLTLSTVEFKSYTVDELTDILQERATLARLPTNELAIRVAARLAFKNHSDVRYGLSLLLKAGRIAKKSGDTLTVDLIKQFDVTQSPKQANRELEIQDDHKRILESLKSSKGEAFSNEVFKKYIEDGGKIAERTFRKYVRQLIDWKFVEEEEVAGRGRRRRLRILQ